MFVSAPWVLFVGEWSSKFFWPCSCFRFRYGSAFSLITKSAHVLLPFEKGAWRWFWKSSLCLCVGMGVGMGVVGGAKIWMLFTWHFWLKWLCGQQQRRDSIWIRFGYLATLPKTLIYNFTIKLAMKRKQPPQPIENFDVSLLSWNQIKFAKLFVILQFVFHPQRATFIVTRLLNECPTCFIHIHRDSIQFSKIICLVSFVASTKLFGRGKWLWHEIERLKLGASSSLCLEALGNHIWFPFLYHSLTLSLSLYLFLYLSMCRPQCLYIGIQFPLWQSIEL